MRLKQLNINGFRCYESLDLSFENRINIISGSNGAGKTSILEAIYFLSTGKSFRSKRIKNLIKHNTDSLTIYAQYFDFENQTNKLGINLSQSLNKTIKFNGEKLKLQSKIAHKFPVVSIDPDSYLFLDKPPQYRRSFLDWLVFHVEHSYLQTWSKVSRCQKQLNSLFKNKQHNQLEQWEQAYIEFGTGLTQLRLKTFNKLQDIIKSKIALIVPELAAVELTFYKGWSKDNDLADQISHDRDKNLLYGNLNSGVHKMDIKNHINSKPAHENLSRGQKKLISIIYYLSYIELISTELNITPILCLDDIDAELDSDKTQVLCDFIQKNDHQVFISTVDPNKLSGIFKDANMFHVEHNQVIRK